MSIVLCHNIPTLFLPRCDHYLPGGGENCQGPISNDQKRVTMPYVCLGCCDHVIQNLYRPLFGIMTPMMNHVQAELDRSNIGGRELLNSKDLAVRNQIDFNNNNFVGHIITAAQAFLRGRDIAVRDILGDAMFNTRSERMAKHAQEYPFILYACVRPHFRVSALSAISTCYCSANLARTTTGSVYDLGTGVEYLHVSGPYKVLKAYRAADTVIDGGAVCTYTFGSLNNSSLPVTRQDLSVFNIREDALDSLDSRESSATLDINICECYSPPQRLSLCAAHHAADLGQWDLWPNRAIFRLHGFHEQRYLTRQADDDLVHGIGPMLQKWRLWNDDPAVHIDVGLRVDDDDGSAVDGERLPMPLIAHANMTARTREWTRNK